MKKVLSLKSLNGHFSLEQEESSKKVSVNSKALTSQLMHKEGYRERSTHFIKDVKFNGQVTQTNNATPRTRVSIEFAAKQFFQILLMDIKSRHAQLNNKLEPVASAFSV